MATYKKVSALSVASALAGTEAVLAVQTNASVYTTPEQIATYVHANPAGVTATSIITGEYIFTEDAELDYSGSLSDGQTSALTTFTELPADTVAVLAYLSLGDEGTEISLHWKRTSGGTFEYIIGSYYADAGTNRLRGCYWLPTGGNSIYVTTVYADTTIVFTILGYKTGA